MDRYQGRERLERPGNYEAPFGLPLPELIYEWAGGPQTDRAVQAVTMAGPGGLLKASDLDATLDELSLRARGSMLGAGGMIVFDDTRDIMNVAYNAMEFFVHESCDTSALENEGGIGFSVGWLPMVPIPLRLRFNWDSSVCSH